MRPGYTASAPEARRPATDPTVATKVSTPIARAPLHTRRQALSPSPHRWRQRAGALFARSALLVLTAALSTYGIYEAQGVVSAGGVTPLEWVFLALFGLNFTWVSYTLVQCALGFLVSPRRERQVAPSATLRTALLIPIYEEDARNVAANALAMAAALSEDRRSAGRFGVYLLSDTQTPAAMVAEELVARSALEQAPAACPVHYRRRSSNTERKAGNVADWVAEHGRAWDAMVVLDADSLMSVECLLRLADRLRANPDLGLIQTLPVVVGARTLFARTQQFAGACYGHLYARGLAAWHGRSGNYWGHNAIVRIDAFVEAARLPILPGKAPFGGDLLSHDFVEAAFLRRAGWGVRFDADLEGSFEQAPPGLIDTIVRDRRWCQGNLQHLSVLGARGLTLASRLHLATGAYAYLSAPVWFALVLTGLGLALQVQLVPPDYFAEPSLFPTWPVFDTQRAIRLLGITAAVVLTPKVLALITVLLQPRRWRMFAGPLNVTASVIFETLSSALYAPVLMAAQCQTVASVLLRSDTGWAPQNRDRATISLRQAVRAHWGHTLIGVGLAAIAYWVERDLWYWLLPLTAGLIGSVALSWLSSSERMGTWCRWVGLARVPSECQPDPLLGEATHWHERLPSAPSSAEPLLTLAGDAALRRWHFAMLPQPPSVTERFSEALLGGLAKADRCADLAQLSSWLNDAQLRALLGHKPFGDQLESLMAKRSAA